MSQVVLCARGGRRPHTRGRIWPLLLASLALASPGWAAGTGNALRERVATRIGDSFRAETPRADRHTAQDASSVIVVRLDRLPISAILIPPDPLLLRIRGPDL